MLSASAHSDDNLRANTIERAAPSRLIYYSDVTNVRHAFGDRREHRAESSNAAALDVL